MIDTVDSLLSGARWLRPSRANAPNIGRCLWNGRPALVKSYHHCSSAYRHTVGRLALDREWWALRRLEGSRRAPLPLARPLPWVVVMEWIEGTPLEALSPNEISAGRLVGETLSLLESLADAGVVHGDIGHDHWSVHGRESNILVGTGGHLIAIDFAGSWSLAGPARPWHGLARALKLHDQLLLTKVLYHLGDDSVIDHPGWRLPSQRTLAWWELMKLLGKV